MNVLKYKKGAALAAAVVTAACVAALASAAGLLYYADCTGERVARALFAPAGNALAEAGGQDAGWDGAAEISFEGAYGAPVPATLFPPGEGAAGTSGSEGVLVVLLPEAGATRRSLYPLARSFAENAYEAVAVDLRGYGGQGDAAGGALSTFGYLESDDLRRCLDGLAGRGMGRNGLILYGQGVGAAAAALCAEGLGAELRALVVDGLFAEAAELSETAAGEFLSFAPARDGAAGILAAGPAGGAYSGFELLCAGRYMMDEYGYEAPAASPLAALAGVTAPTMIIHDPADGVVAPDSGERLYEASAAERKELVAAGIAHGGAQPAGGGLSSYMRAIYGFIGLHDDFVIADDEIDRDPSNPAMASGTPLFRGGDLLFEDGAFNQFYFDGGMADSFIGAVNEAYATLGDETRVHLLLAPMPCEFYVPEPYWSSFNASQEDALAYVRERLDDGVEMVDAYRLIKAHRDEYLYFRTDHHWSALGAYYAYRAFARSIGEVPQELAGLERIDSPKPYYGSRYTDSTRNYLAKAVDEFWYYDLGDLGYTFSAYPAGGGRSSRKTVFSPSAMGAKQQYYAFMGGDYPYCRIDREAAGGRRIAVVKDSYANAFIPWLIPHFEQIHVIDPRHYEGSLQSLVRDEGITDLLFMDYALVLGIPPYAEAIRGILQ